MKKMLDKLFAAMQDADGVPALEDSVTALLDQFADQRKQPRPVADKVIEDVALTQQVLKLANSPMYAPFATDVGSVSSAVKVLGDDAVMHLVLNAPVVSAADLHAQPSLSLTLHAAEIARALGGHRSEDASIATMMHNLGHLLVARLLPEEFDGIGQRIRAGEAQDAACRGVLGMTYQQVGKEVATRWNLPATIVSVIEGHGDPELQKLAELSNSAAILADQGQHEEAARLVAGAALPGADTEKLQAVLNRRKYEPVKSAASPHPSRPASPSPLTELYLRLAEMEHDSCETLAGRMFLEVQQTLGTARALLLRPKENGEYRVSYAFGKGRGRNQGQAAPERRIQADGVSCGHLEKCRRVDFRCQQAQVGGAARGLPPAAAQGQELPHPACRTRQSGRTDLFRLGARDGSARRGPAIAAKIARPVRAAVDEVSARADGLQPVNPA